MKHIIYNGYVLILKRKKKRRMQRGRKKRKHTHSKSFKNNEIGWGSLINILIIILIKYLT